MYAKFEIEQAIQTELKILDTVATGMDRFQFLLWRCATPCLVVPRSVTSHPNFEGASLRTAKLGYPIAVRETGGGPVIQSSGIINISIAFTMSEGIGNHIKGAYRLLCEPVMQILRQHDIDPAYGAIEGAMCDGAYNIVVNDRKLAGTAQRWRRIKSANEGYAVLGHLCLSVDADHAEACYVVNAFYASLGVGTRVRAASHINWVEVASPVGLSGMLNNSYGNLGQTSLSAHPHLIPT